MPFQSLSSLEYAELRSFPEVSIHSAILQCSHDSFQSDVGHDTDSLPSGYFTDTALTIFIFDSWHLSVINCDPVLAEVILILYVET
jgi:hypothetical protein